MNIESFQWVDKYSPKSINATILAPDIKEIFEGYVAQGALPNMILSGSQGIGKTSIVRAAVKELGAELLEINGSLEGNIDTLRNKITDFVSAMSMDGSRKYVLIDEADHLNPNSTQPALRKFMEDHSDYCSFILTANYPYKIIKELHSRCSKINFFFNAQTIGPEIDKFFVRAKKILEAEEIEYDEKVVKELVKKLAPDWRQVLHTLQTAAVRSGKIDVDILATSDKDESFRKLARSMKKKDFGEVREWVTKENIMTPAELFEQLYLKLPMILTEDSIPAMILIVAKYQYQSAFAASQEINNAACLTEILLEVEFK